MSITPVLQTSHTLPNLTAFSSRMDLDNDTTTTWKPKRRSSTEILPSQSSRASYKLNGELTRQLDQVSAVLDRLWDQRRTDDIITTSSTSTKPTSNPTRNDDTTRCASPTPTPRARVPLAPVSGNTTPRPPPLPSAMRNNSARRRFSSPGLMPIDDNDTESTNTSTMVDRDGDTPMTMTMVTTTSPSKRELTRMSQKAQIYPLRTSSRRKAPVHTAPALPSLRHLSSAASKLAQRDSMGDGGGMALLPLTASMRTTTTTSRPNTGSGMFSPTSGGQVEVKFTFAPEARTSTATATGTASRISALSTTSTSTALTTTTQSGPPSQSASTAELMLRKKMTTIITQMVRRILRYEGRYSGEEKCMREKMEAVVKIEKLLVGVVKWDSARARRSARDELQVKLDKLQQRLERMLSR